MVAEDDAGRAEELRAGGGAATDRSGARNVDGGARSNPRLDTAVIPGGQNIGEQGEIPDLFDRLVLIGELQKLEVRPRHKHVFGLAALPSAKIEAVGAAISELFIGVEAHIRVAFLAVPACSARHVERHRAGIADLDALNMGAHLDNLTGILVAHLHSLRRLEAAVIDMQVAAADVCRDKLENDSVLDLPALRILKLGISLVLDLHLVWSHKRDGAITCCHDQSPCFQCSRELRSREPSCPIFFG